MTSRPSARFWSHNQLPVGWGVIGQDDYQLAVVFRARAAKTEWSLEDFNVFILKAAA